MLKKGLRKSTSHATPDKNTISVLSDSRLKSTDMDNPLRNDPSNKNGSGLSFPILYLATIDGDVSSLIKSQPV